MAEIADSGGGGHDKGKKRAKKSSTRVDMTPMVDLAFLLLTFFVLTSTFSKPKVMSLAYPAKIDEPVDNNAPKLNNGITFLLSKDKVFYYTGEFYPADRPGKNGPTVLTETNFSASGLRKVLADLNSYVLLRKEGMVKKVKAKQMADTTYTRQLEQLKGKPEALKVLVKTDDKALCKNFIDLIDEVKIAEIGVIAPVPMLPAELKLLETQLKK
ncbi:MAG: biopolymer transporter ExbD [Crocinitomicaceae bacterium]|nr:biopolymer transporter ExbD [Crocinitomicaceae bacterium]